MPEVADYLNQYEMCRGLQLVQTEHDKGSGKTASRLLKIQAFPTGFTILPYAGGVEDQPHRMMTFFEIFLATERSEAFKSLKT